MLKAYTIGVITALILTFIGIIVIDIVMVGPEDDIDEKVVKLLVGLAFIPVVHWLLIIWWLILIARPKKLDEFTRNTLDKILN